jgi:hypothetical protein
MPRHQHRGNRDLRVVLTAAGRGRARFIWRLLDVRATDTAVSISGSGATGVGTLRLRPMAASIEWVGVIFSDLHSIIPPLQGWGICGPWTQGVALGYRIWPRWG